MGRPAAGMSKIDEDDLDIIVAFITGQNLAHQPAVAEQLRKACQALRTHILNPENVSALTGRLKRRVVLD